MNNYPLMMIIGFSTDELLVDWKFRTIIHCFLIAAVLGVFIHFHLKFLLSLEQIEEQRKQTIQSAKLSSLGEMASGIAHEINNPLTIIMATAQKMKKRREENEKAFQSQIDKIRTTTDRIAKIIKGLHFFLARFL